MADSAAPAAASSDAELPKNLSGGALDAQGEGAIKVILLGDSAVGKSKLVERFLMNDYQPRQLSTYALTLFRHVAAVIQPPIFSSECPQVPYSGMNVQPS